jgi:hypothetical protein
VGPRWIQQAASMCALERAGRLVGGPCMAAVCDCSIPGLVTAPLHLFDC